MSKKVTKKVGQSTRQLEKKAGQKQLEFLEGVKRRWMATVDAIIDPLMLVDKDFNILQTNRALATHAERDVKKVIGSKCYKMFAGRSSPCPGCKLRNGMETMAPQTFELNNIDGQYFEVTSQPIVDIDGHLEGSLQIYRDRTLARQLQNQLVQNEKLASIGLLAGGIAHELNNPLGGILLFSQMLLREIPKDSPHLPDVQEIETAAKRCKAIVESLLDFARSQPTKDRVETVDLVEALKSAFRFSRVGGGLMKYEIIEDYQDNEVLTVGNRNKIVQVLLNLIQNGLQAMPTGGKMTLRAYSEQDRSIIEILDTGIGIPPDSLKKIFDPFYTSKAEGEGTGLGLSICHGIIEELGGKIEVKSKVNKGSCFRITLPQPPKIKQVG